MAITFEDLNEEECEEVEIEVDKIVKIEVFDLDILLSNHNTSFKF